MANYRDFDDVVYIAGVTFKSQYGEHPAGSVVKEAKKFQNLEALVDNRFLYPIAPEGGYDYLPPHLFNHIDLKDEAMAKIAAGDKGQFRGHYLRGKPEMVKQAEAEADAQHEIHENLKKTPDEAAAEKAAEKRAEELAAPEMNLSEREVQIEHEEEREKAEKPAAKKTTAKKTTAKKEEKK